MEEENGDFMNLLENGKCVQKCDKSVGNRPNNAKTQCINKVEFPIIYTPFSVVAFTCFIVIIVVQKLKKDTNIVPSAIAMLSIIEFFATLF